MAECPADTAVFLDFDGTLAPLVDDPAEARPLGQVPGLLHRLADRFGLVAVVSGRPASFLSAVLGVIPNLEMYGLYGMERVLGDGVVHLSDEAAAWRPVVEAVVLRALGEAGRREPGWEVEDKGLSVTLHWRRDPTGEVRTRRFASAEAARTGLIAQDGRMSVELRPPIGVDKGTVVRRAGARFQALAFFGDDLGDLAAFDALDELAAAGVLVAKVAVLDGESAREVVAASDVAVTGPEGAVALLERMLDPT